MSGKKTFSTSKISMLNLKSPFQSIKKQLSTEFHEVGRGKKESKNKIRIE